MGRQHNPENAWIKKAGLKYVSMHRGSYRYYPPGEDGKRGKSIVLAPKGATPQDVIKRYKEVVNAPTGQTISWLLQTYMAGVKDLAPRTLKDYQRYQLRLCEYENFGAVPLAQVTPRTIKGFLDAYPAPIQANRFIQYLKAAWNWVLLRQKIPDNPCMNVPLNKQASRTRYITDDEYNGIHRIGSQQRVPFLPIALELAYLLRARVGEIIALRREHLLTEGVLLNRGKGSKSEITEWSQRLRNVIDAADQLHPATISPWILHRADGKQLTYSAINQAFTRAQEKLIEEGICPDDDTFTFHDLKARGITDHPTKHGGHKSAKMAEVYDRLPEVVKPTR